MFLESVDVESDSGEASESVIESSSDTVSRLSISEFEGRVVSLFEPKVECGLERESLSAGECGFEQRAAEVKFDVKSLVDSRVRIYPSPVFESLWRLISECTQRSAERECEQYEGTLSQRVSSLIASVLSASMASWCGVSPLLR